MLTQLYTYNIESATIGKQRNAVPIIDAKQEYKRLFLMPVLQKKIRFRMVVKTRNIIRASIGNL